MRDFYSERKYKILNIYREISIVNENTRFLIYKERFLPVNENTRFLIYIERDLYSERKYNVCNIYIERDFYSERKYKMLNIYREISVVN